MSDKIISVLKNNKNATELNRGLFGSKKMQFE